jgi:hypothetical protein
MTTGVARLAPGSITQEHFDLLVKISTIRTANIINAMGAVLVNKGKQIDVCREYGISPALLSRKLLEIAEASDVAQKISVFYR